MRTLEIAHRTRCECSEPVWLGDHQLMFRPRDSHDLRLLRTGFVIEPAAHVRWIHDHFGNSIAIASFEELVQHHPARAFARAARTPADRGIRPHLAVQLRGRGGTRLGALHRARLPEPEFDRRAVDEAVYGRRRWERHVRASEAAVHVHPAEAELHDAVRDRHAGAGRHSRAGAGPVAITPF